MTVGWGASANNLPALEAALGRPVDFTRVYGWVGKIPTGVEALASQRRVVVSMKFRDASGATIPAVDITAGNHDAEIKAFIAWFNALPTCAAGPHALIDEHEIDAKAAAASGTTAQLNAAFDYCVKLARGSAGWKGWASCCVTGYDPNNRELLYAVDFAESDVICIDQPYTNGPAPWASADSVAGPTVDYFTKAYPGKPILITEWGATADPARAAWLAAFAAALKTPRYAQVLGAIYWNDTTGSFDTRLTTSADMAAWAAAGKLLQPAPVPPPPPVPTTVPVAIAAMHALTDATSALVAAKQASDDAQATWVAKQADYAAKYTAALAAIKAVTG